MMQRGLLGERASEKGAVHRLIESSIWKQTKLGISDGVQERGGGGTRGGKPEKHMMHVCVRVW